MLSRAAKSDAPAVEPEAPPAPVLTIPEVARYLRVAEKTVYGLVRRGELKAFRVGRVMRCSRDEVARFISGNVRPDGVGDR